MSVVWVTRPEPFSQPLIDFLQENGYQAYYFPCLEIVPTPLLEWPDCDWLVVTSQHTVRILRNKLKSFKGPVFTVGPKTGSALQKLGVDVYYPRKKHCSEAMVNELFSASFPKGRGLVLDGLPRETRLLSMLIVRGLEFEVLCCYQRKAVQWGDMHDYCVQQGVPDSAILTSSQVLKSYLDLVKSQPSLPFKLINTIVVSDPMFSLACHEGIESVNLAVGSGMLQLLERL
jgi:uroporphyrinogen-III synthase